RVEYVNSSENSLGEVCFFLYANSFAEGETAVSTAYTHKAYPNGESYANITIQSVKVGGEEGAFSVEENSILNVGLKSELFQEEIVTIEMEYVVKLANIRHRLGFNDKTVNFGNFFPIACVYEDGEGFVKPQFSANGDPFYSDISDFEVKISYPESYVLATSGQQMETSGGETKTTTCRAENVRDFAFVLSTEFQKLSAKVGEVVVNYFSYEDENAHAHLETACKAVGTFEELFGDYPYAQLSVVKAGFCFGGMEYPNLVMIADDLKDDGTFDYVIVHEIAHQWWYGMVGNNEFEEAWVDEGLTEFSTALFYEKNPDYGLEYQEIMTNATATYQNFVKIYTDINGDVSERMDRNLLQFDTEPEYVNCTYTKGMLLFNALRQTMSERKFFNCLKDYFEAMKFKNSSAEKMVECFSKSSRINLETFFEAWISGQVLIGS
ncbi:MAG: M1 family metallopeptidase, partial [Clostridia bacterium]|nr:M1 family metallopeptidase [Clostridia bacterium]